MFRWLAGTPTELNLPEDAFGDEEISARLVAAVAAAFAFFDGESLCRGLDLGVDGVPPCLVARGVVAADRGPVGLARAAILSLLCVLSSSIRFLSSSS